jgi:leucyl aminopeptidase
MDLKFTDTAVKGIKDDAIAVGVFEKGGLKGQAADLDKWLNGAISKGIKAGSISLKAGMVTVLFQPGGMKFDLYLLGLGDEKKLKVHLLRKHIANGVKEMMKREVQSATLLFDGPKDAGEAMRYLRGACDTFLLRTYEFAGYRSEKITKKPFKRLTVNITDKKLFKAASPSAKNWRYEAEGVRLARDLTNAPANKMSPDELAKEARKMCRQAGLKCRVLGKPEIEKLKMGAFLAVNAGSAKPPRFIIMEYTPKPVTAKTKTVCIVGKGLTFDSGGISLKPWDGMWDMKGDMGGAAATIGIMRSIAALKPRVRVVGLCPCTENMPDGNALKPGDVIHTASGKSIEIHSTDAEGRLVLADGLEYATKKYKPDVLFDLATLTGACVVALGHDIIGLFTDDNTLAHDLAGIGDAANEPVWPMPMFEEYYELLKSDVADQKNVGGRWAGAITAALFLRRFTNVKKYAHLDIAGPGLTGAEKWHGPKGGSGSGVRLVVEYIMGMK